MYSKEGYKPHNFTVMGHPEVLRDLVLKAQNPDKYPNIVNVVVYRGAGVGQCVGAGTADAMDTLGLTEGVDYFVGESSGLPDAWSQKNKLRGARNFYYERNIKNKLFNPLRNPWLDIITLVRMFQDEQPINLEEFRNSPQRIIAGFTEWRSGRRVTLDMGRLENPHLGLLGSQAVPIITGNLSIKIDQPGLYIPGRLVDGWVSDTQALHAAFEETEVFNPKSKQLEIFSANRFASGGKIVNYFFVNPDPFDHRIPEAGLIEKPIRALVRAGMPGIWYVMATFPRRFNQDSQTLEKIVKGEIPLHPNIRVSTFVATQNPIDPVCMDSATLYYSQEEAYTTFTDYIRSQINS